MCEKIHWYLNDSTLRPLSLSLSACVILCLEWKSSVCIIQCDACSCTLSLKCEWWISVSLDVCCITLQNQLWAVMLCCGFVLWRLCGLKTRLTFTCCRLSGEMTGGHGWFEYVEHDDKARSGWSVKSNCVHLLRKLLSLIFSLQERRFLFLCLEMWSFDLENSSRIDTSWN